jgi:hypothetical protein
MVEAKKTPSGSKSKKCSELVAWIQIPVYGHEMEFVVTDNSGISQMARKDRYDLDDCDACPGVFCYDRWKFGMILERRSISHGLIAHEAFHATHRIMEYIGDKFDKKHHEPYAYLNEHLTTRIYANLKEWKIKVT